MFTSFVFLILLRLDLTLEYFSMQVSINSVLATRIVLNIRGTMNQHGQPSELHTSFHEMHAVTARYPRLVSDEDSQEQANQAFVLKPYTTITAGT
jgi:hypothetical protein